MTRAERLGLEPGSVRRDADNLRHPSPYEDEVRLSIAISLKRIADALERLDSTMAHWSTKS